MLPLFSNNKMQFIILQTLRTPGSKFPAWHLKMNVHNSGGNLKIKRSHINVPIDMAVEKFLKALMYI